MTKRRWQLLFVLSLATAASLALGCDEEDVPVVEQTNNGTNNGVFNNNNDPNNGTPNNGTANNGTDNNRTNNGTPNNGTPNNGTPNNGTANNGTDNNGTDNNANNGSVTDNNGDPCANVDCDDDNPCTTDVCAGGECTNTPSNAACDDGNACTVDTCGANGCENTPMDALCDDRIACTTDRCDAQLGCVHTTDDSACSDGVECTADRCDERLGCVHDDDDSRCADAFDCTANRCAGAAGCVTISDDGRCAPGQLCRPDRGCVDPALCTSPDDPRCDDGQTCTADRCDTNTGRCVYTPNHTACDDNQFCNGTQQCVPFFGCALVSVPQCDDGVICTVDQCNETTDSCEHRSLDALCNDGRFCTGSERCDDTLGCVAENVPTCDDGLGCNTDLCDPNLDRCVHIAPDPDGDGDGDAACGGNDCDELDPNVNSLAPEVCNAIDDNCDGQVDEGVTSACGNCDPTCLAETVGGDSGSDFQEPGMTGTIFDDTRGGLVITEEVETVDVLWVPNTNESTFSKWDVETATEIGRYRVGLPAYACPGSCCHSSGCNMPSRVAIDGRGDAYVANRGFGIQGTLSKVAGSADRCVDRNGNGMLDTSSDNQPLAYGTDECVLYTANVGPVNALLRALAIDLGDANHPEGFPWVGGFNHLSWWKLDPDTGAVMLEVPIGFRSYGGIVMPDGKLWISGLDEGRLTYIDTRTGLPAGRFWSYPTNLRPSGCINSYGITADARGRIWLSGWTCNDALGFDPGSGQFTWVNTTRWGMNAGRGITSDTTGRIWMALGGDGQSHVAIWDTDRFRAGGIVAEDAIQVIRLPDGHTGPSGIGADRAGNMWLAHHATSQLVKINPNTFQMQSFTGPNRVYTYSDFTGSVRRTVIGRGSYVQDFNAGCDVVRWDDLSWEGEFPAGSRVIFTVQSAATQEDLMLAEAATTAIAPNQPSPANIEQALTNLNLNSMQYLRVGLALESNRDGASPIVRSFRVSWTCLQ